ncbi:hypothetical protein [Metabacillus sp. 84]|uniref:hypothetical protein n=1 Tax=Metabacillus sp. 84 TaxID=3404705 RepID=UPI003CF644FC
MSVNEVKIQALTKRIAKLKQRQHTFEQNGDKVAAALAGLTVVLFQKDLEELLSE